MDVGEDNYQAVTLKEVLRGVTDAVPQVANRATPQFAPPRRRRMLVATARPS